jgi:hypothetical protein
MEKVARFLFKIDEVVFEKIIIQYFLLSFFAVTILGTMTGVFNTSVLTAWIAVGFIVYLGLFTYRFLSNKDELKYVKELYQDKGSFPFMKGFNYALLLGPLGLALAVFLAFLPRDK